MKTRKTNTSRFMNCMVPSSDSTHTWQCAQPFFHVSLPLTRKVGPPKILSTIKLLYFTIMPLLELSKSLHNCQRCKLAKMGRTQVVFGVGNPHASVMFVGEAPGFH